MSKQNHYQFRLVIVWSHTDIMTSTLCLNISSCKRLLPDQSTHNNPPSNIQQFPFRNMQSENFLVCWTHCHNLYFLFVNLSQCKILDIFKTPINKHDFLIGLQMFWWVENNVMQIGQSIHHMTKHFTHLSSRLLYRSVYSIFTTHCWYQQCLWEFVKLQHIESSN